MKRFDYIYDCDNRVGGGEYMSFDYLGEAMEYADRRAEYTQRDIYIWTGDKTYCRRWWGTTEGIEECEDPIQFGDFGFYGDWEEISEDNSEFFDSIMAEIPPVYRHVIKSYEELLEFIEERKDDKKAHYYYGPMECFNNDFFTIEDLAKDAEPSWVFNDEDDDDGSVGIFEW